MSTPEVVTNVNDVDLSKPTLLCISDFEGCAKEAPSLNKIPQSQTLCGITLFSRITELLQNNDSFQVAFLGDYFDKGPHIESVITGIANMKETYVERVHIILGNRDVNKMRIPVEALKQMKKPSEGTDNWPDWTGPNWKNFLSSSGNNTYNDSEVDPVNRTNQLLINTYGAVGSLSFIGANDEAGLVRITDTFSSKVSEDSFVNKCRYLFQNAKLIEVVNVGVTKVLISHAGTYNLNMFKVSDDFLTSVGELTFLEADYFQQMDDIRVKLSTTIIEGEGNLSKAISFYNGILSDVVTQMCSTEDLSALLSNPGFYKKYLLLQAMGLKPNLDNPNTFLSPIDSCGVGGCTNIKELPQDFANFIKEQDIKVIAHGHVPFCGTVPLIHGEGGIGFLSCDTSNGNRPKVKPYDDTLIIEDTKLSVIPLGYITEDAIGISSISTDNITAFVKLSREETVGYSNDGKTENMFKFMIGEFPLTNLPSIGSEDRTVVKYPNGVSFKLNGGFTPATNLKGGKRKSKKNHKKSHKSKKQGGKRTRKANKKTHRCSSHGCRH